MSDNSAEESTPLASTKQNPPANPYASPALPAGAAGLRNGANAALILLLAINLFNYIDRQVLAGVVPKIQADFHASDAEVGWLQMAFLLSYMVAAPVFGWLADRFNRWLLVGVGVVIWSLASGASGLATGFGMLLVTRLCVGIGEAAYGPTAPTILADLYPLARRGRILAIFYVAIPVGSALGYLLAGAVLGWGFTWHWAFFFVVPPGIVLGLIAIFMRDRPRGAADGDANGVPLAAAEGSPTAVAALPHKARIADYRVLIRIPSYVLNTAGMAAMTFALGGIGFWMPKYIVWRQIQDKLLDMTDKTAMNNALGAANSKFGPIVVVAGLLGTLAGGWAGDRLRGRFSGAYFLVSAAAMIVGFPLFLALLITPFPYAWGMIFAASFCLFFNTGPTNTVLANVVHPSIRAAGYALNIFVIHILGDAISPTLIGWINALWAAPGGDVVWGGNMNAGFFAVSISILIGGLFWLWGARHLARDTELAPTRIAPDKYNK